MAYAVRTAYAGALMSVPVSKDELDKLWSSGLWGFSFPKERAEGVKKGAELAFTFTGDGIMHPDGVITCEAFITSPAIGQCPVTLQRHNVQPTRGFGLSLLRFVGLA